MAQAHDEILAAGARVVGISVDSPEKNAAMVAKLRLPFPLLSDPGGEAAIRPYDVWHDEANIARPAAVLVVAPGEEAFRDDARDFADRPSEEELVDRIAALGLQATTQDRPIPGDPKPSRRAADPGWLPAYYRGASFATKAISMRVPEARQEAEAYQAMLKRYSDAIKRLQSSG